MYIKVWEALLYIPRLPSGQFLPLVFAPNISSQAMFLEGYIDRHTLKDNVAYFLELYIVYTVYF